MKRDPALEVRLALATDRLVSGVDSVDRANPVRSDGSGRHVTSQSVPERAAISAWDVTPRCCGRHRRGAPKRHPQRRCCVPGRPTFRRRVGGPGDVTSFSRSPGAQRSAQSHRFERLDVATKPRVNGLASRRSHVRLGSSDDPTPIRARCARYSRDAEISRRFFDSPKYVL